MISSDSPLSEGADHVCFTYLVAQQVSVYFAFGDFLNRRVKKFAMDVSGVFRFRNVLCADDEIRLNEFSVGSGDIMFLLSSCK